MQVFSLRGDKRKIPSYTRSLSQLLDTSDIRTLGRYILELKQRRENKLQNKGSDAWIDHDKDAWIDNDKGDHYHYQFKHHNLELKDVSLFNCCDAWILDIDLYSWVPNVQQICNNHFLEQELSS